MCFELLERSPGVRQNRKECGNRLFSLFTAALGLFITTHRKQCFSRANEGSPSRPFCVGHGPQFCVRRRIDLMPSHHQRSLFSENKNQVPIRLPLLRLRLLTEFQKWRFVELLVLFYLRFRRQRRALSMKAKLPGSLVRPFAASYAQRAECRYRTGAPKRRNLQLALSFHVANSATGTLPCRSKGANTS